MAYWDDKPTAQERARLHALRVAAHYRKVKRERWGDYPGRPEVDRPVLELGHSGWGRGAGSLVDAASTVAGRRRGRRRARNRAKA